jgi:glycyl-tRNA synthetase alpha chain
MYIQNVDNFRDIQWNESVKYGDLFYVREQQFSEYNFTASDTIELFDRFNIFEKQCSDLLEEKLLYPAYDLLLKCSHSFNLLDAAGVISVTERAAYIGRIRKLAKECATAFLSL